MVEDVREVGRLFRLGGRGVGVGKSGGNNPNRYSRVSGGESSNDSATWEDADPEQLWRTVVAITQAGDAVTLGKTRDGGALSLVILSGDERERRYARGEDEVTALLRSVREVLEATD